MWISWHLVGLSKSPQRKMEPQVSGRISALGSSRRRFLPTEASPTGQAGTCPRGQTGPQEGLWGVTLCVWGSVICLGCCGINLTPLSAQGLLLGWGIPQAEQGSPKGRKQQQDPLGFPSQQMHPGPLQSQDGERMKCPPTPNTAPRPWHPPQTPMSPPHSW